MGDRVVDEAKFSSVLSDFASTLATDFPIQSILDHLVERIVDVLPISSAGVTLISAQRVPRYIAASDSSAMRYEELQTRLEEGPCLRAFNSGDPVAISDLGADDRFPRFGPQAMAEGLAAVFAFPLRHGEALFGALDLYRDSVGDLSDRDMDVAQTLADVTAAYVLNAQGREDARTNASHFERIALHDGLTGLPNRLLLQNRLKHAAQRARRSRACAAVIFVDLDRFKQVNDAHGHRVGDELLLAVAHRLSQLIRAGDTLARVSGDEFVFLCEDMASPGDAHCIAERIHEAFAEPFSPEGIDVRITASVGMAFAGPGDLISEGMIAQADLAMYQAKRESRRGVQVLDAGTAGAAIADANLEADLRRALSDDGLDIAYQPIVRTADGFVVGVEALLRWTHPALGALPAASVVGLAERSGLIIDVGAWMMERACRDRARWLRREPGRSLDVAVNVSVKQLVHPGFGLSVASVLNATGMDPAALVLEITEDVLISETERAVAALTQLKSLGVRIALDDFGSGYSSLSYLSRLPIDIVKIDQSFIADIDHGRPGGAIAAAVTDLSHTLGLSVVAEGVATQAQRDGVHDMGCEAAQGYFFARPMPAGAVSRLESSLPSDGPAIEWRAQRSG